MGSPQPSPIPASQNPVQSEPPSYLLVLSAGIATSALTLFGIYWLDINARDFHIMGWYADYMIPVGALLVGIVAASGYGIVSWISGIKITRMLLLAVLLLQVGAYFGAQYVEFSSMHYIHKGSGTPLGLLEYFDLMARSFAWKQDNGSEGSPLGVWGYLFRGLEIIGFAAGGLVVPLMLFNMPYCGGCSRYMKSKLIACVPASVAVKKFKKSDKEANAAHQAEQENAFKSSHQLLEMLQQMAMEGRVADFQKAVEPLKLKKSKKMALKLPVRTTLHLVSCRQCAAGWLKVTQMTGQGKQLKQTELARTGVPQEFVKALQSKS